jgi:hypothetical protein
MLRIRGRHYTDERDGRGNPGDFGARPEVCPVTDWNLERRGGGLSEELDVSYKTRCKTTQVELYDSPSRHGFGINPSGTYLTATARRFDNKLCRRKCSFQGREMSNLEDVRNWRLTKKNGSCVTH